MAVESFPPQLGSRFSVGEARRAGVTSGRLRSAELQRPFHGVREVDAEGQRTHLDLMLAYATRISPHAFFSHGSAATAWNLPVPAALRLDHVHVSVARPRRAPGGRGVRGHSLNAESVSVREHPVHGIRLTSPPTTWVHLASEIDHPYDLVALGDAIVRRPQHRQDPEALGSLDQLEAAVMASRRRGARALRSALNRVRDGSSSRPESWTRLLLVDAGLPEPCPAHVVRAPDGSFVARLDLAYPDRNVGLEYEGEHHLRDRRQWQRDIRRYEMLADLGWRVVRLTSRDVFTDAGPFLTRVARLLR